MIHQPLLNLCFPRLHVVSVSLSESSSSIQSCERSYLRFWIYDIHLESEIRFLVFSIHPNHSFSWHFLFEVSRTNKMICSFCTKFWLHKPWLSFCIPRIHVVFESLLELCNSIHSCEYFHLKFWNKNSPGVQCQVPCLQH